MGKHVHGCPVSLTDSRVPTCQTPQMDEDQELLNQLMVGMAPETRHRMQRFIQLVAERDQCALTSIRQIEAGRVSPTDGLDALDRCLEARH